MYEIHTPDTAPAGSKAALEAIRDRVGFIPNLAATMGASPALVGGFNEQQGILRSAVLTAPEREVVGLTVSYFNTAAHSMAIHSTFASKVGLAPEVLSALRAGLPLPDPKLQTLHEFTLALLRQRGHVEPERVQALEAAGYTTEHMFDVIAQVGYTSIANWVANVCEPPLDEVFKPQYWSSAIL